ncbi:MAG: RCC1 domain-containing protein, partial [Verrucomicrobiota bacterium]
MRTNALTVDAQGNIQLWTTQSPPPAALVVPSGLSNVVDVALGDSFAAALKSDGTVTCWGDITNSPASAGLSNVTQIAAGSAHLLALTANGEVIAWGNNDYGQASVPSSLSNVIAIAASLVNSLAVQADGHAVGWGGTSPGQFDVLQTETNTAAIATGPQHITLLRKNGSVASFSRLRLTLGATNVPPGLTNVVAIAAGNLFSLALDADGAVVSWGAIAPPPAAV